MRLVAWRAGVLFALWVSVIVAAVALDAALHAFGLVWVGFWLGPIGTALIVVSFAYSLGSEDGSRLAHPIVFFACTKPSP